MICSSDSEFLTRFYDSYISVDFSEIYHQNIYVPSRISINYPHLINVAPLHFFYKLHENFYWTNQTNEDHFEGMYAQHMWSNFNKLAMEKLGINIFIYISNITLFS